MSILLKSVLIVDPSSPYHDQIKDVYIKGDQVIKISDSINESAQTIIEEKNLSISPGWIDMHSDFCDPGNEHKESIETGSRAAVIGGFTSVCLTPQTSPVIESKSQIEYIYKKADEQPINIYPLGGLTKNLEGKEINELYDMYENGAVGFYNGKKEVSNPNILKIGLQYTQPFKAPILFFPYQKELSENGQMNEGETSTYLGLKGIPALAEEIEINRLIYLSEYCEKPIHITGVSTAKSVGQIREAKERGLSITASANLYNLVLNDRVLESYDSNYKVLPPIRNELDRLALIQGVKDKIIDCISIDHIPQDVEVKNCEFNVASFGIRGLETAGGVFGMFLNSELNWEHWVQCISINPRVIMDLPMISLKEGSVAEFTLFNQNEIWNSSDQNLDLQSYNNPFLNKDLKGKPYGIINKSRFTKQRI